MNERAGSRRVVLIGELELDLADGVLCREGRRLAVRPQAMKLLCMLARQPGRVVSRAQIRAALWPGGGIAAEQSINACVRQLRKLFEVEATGRIETVPRRGYRLVVGGVEAARAAPAPPPPRGLRLAVALPAGAAIAFAAAMALRMAERVPGPPLVTLAPVVAGAAESERRAARLLERALVERVDGLGPQKATRLPWAVGTAYDARAGVLRRNTAVVPADLVLESEVRSSEEGLEASLHLLRVGDGAVVWFSALRRPTAVELSAAAAAEAAAALALMSDAGERFSSAPDERAPGR